MADSLKDRLRLDLQSIKTEGSTRTVRIRQIVQTAAADAIVELKASVGEIRRIAGHSAHGVAQTLSSDETPTTASVVKGIRSRLADRIKSQLVRLDAMLTTRYGVAFGTRLRDCYSLFKQRLGLFRVWYENSRANAEAIGIDPLQQKQTEIELKIADQGTAVARKEQQIRQQVKELLDTAISKR
jgi:hypothetical protein